MRILIVGCGYVGMEVARSCIAHGHEVHGVRRSPQGLASLAAAGIQPLAGDVSDASSVATWPRRWDVVVNAVSSSGGGVEGYRRAYLDGSTNLAAHLRDSPPFRVVHMGSTSVYPHADASWVNEDSPANPTGEAARVLVAAEQAWLDAWRRHGLPVVLLRASGIYGPGRRRMLAQVLSGEARIDGDGSRWLNMVHRDDVAGAVLAAMARGVPGRIYNVTDNQPVQQRDLLAWLAASRGLPLPAREDAIAQPIHGASSSIRARTNKRVSNRRLRDELGWRPCFPTFREGYAPGTPTVPGSTPTPGPGYAARAMGVNILGELEWRGLISDCTDKEGLAAQLAAGAVTLYCGFDPTADSLHVGSLVPLLALRRFQEAGHRPIAVAGGATGSIGDPSGKSNERVLLTKERIEQNVAAVRPQLARLLDFGARDNAALLVDNADWTAPVSYLDFLRDVGKHFTVNQMVAKESVRARMEDRDVGISYTEFSYMLLQAFDFCHLCAAQGCTLQIGGSDQWGNITAGIELVRKKLGRHAFGLTLPLITKADGTKFGKTESGTVWLDARKTSVYRFYQFWVQADDRDVVRYLKYFTFLGRDEVTALEAAHAANPAGREAHRALAKAVTDLVHGPAATAEAQRASEILFGGGLEGVGESTFAEIVGEVPTVPLAPLSLGDAGLPVLDLFVHAGLVPSKGQARKDLEGGGLYLNNVRLTEVGRRVTASDILFGKHLLLRKGRRNYAVVTVA